jgi:CubicO group peptidase (beta-lactamase class C family)
MIKLNKKLFLNFTKNIALLFFIFSTVEILALGSVKDKILNSIEHFAKDHKIQAIYAVSEKGKIIVNGAQGFYNLEEFKRLNLSQIMPILSVTKQFTAVGILLLQDRKLLSTNNTVAELLPASSGLWLGNKVPSWAHKVTVHHLLSHSSGLPEYIWSIKFDEKQTSKEAATSVLNFVSESPIEFEPGSKYKYNNTGFILLGIIIEHLSKQTLQAFFKNELFALIKMNNTFLLSLEEAIKLEKGLLPNKYPVRYYAVPSKTTPKFNTVSLKIIYAPYGDAGAVSNVEDLIKWNEALHHGKILSNKSYQQMIHPYYKVSDNQTGYAGNVGYGTFISKIHSGHIYYHHSTSHLGVRCDAGYIPKADISLAILSNVMIYVPDEISKKVDFRKPQNQIDISYFRDALLESL